MPLHFSVSISAPVPVREPASIILAGRPMGLTHKARYPDLDAHACTQLIVGHVCVGAGCPGNLLELESGAHPCCALTHPTCAQCQAVQHSSVCSPAHSLHRCAACQVVQHVNKQLCSSQGSSFALLMLARSSGSSGVQSSLRGQRAVIFFCSYPEQDPALDTMARSLIAKGARLCISISASASMQHQLQSGQTLPTRPLSTSSDMS